MIRWRDAGFLTAGLVAGVVFAAKVSAAPPMVVSAPAGASPSTPVVASLGGGSGSVQAARGGPAVAPCAESVTVTRLSDNTLVSVKEHGDAQTVMVYTFDDAGLLRPSPQQAKYFYK